MFCCNDSSFGMFLSNGTMLIAYASGKVAGKAQNHPLMIYGLLQPASIKMSAFVMRAKKEAHLKAMQHVNFRLHTIMPLCLHPSLG